MLKGDCLLWRQLGERPEFGVVLSELEQRCVELEHEHRRPPGKRVKPEVLNLRV